MWKTEEGSTERLIQLCLGYFVFYVITGVSVKYFLSTKDGFPALNGMEYLVYSTAGGALIATGVVLVLRWYHMESVRRVKFGPFNVPSELLYIIPSGVFTAIVIPTTTLMYSFKGISVMLAMVLMRGSVIIIGRVVDAVQIKQGIMTKKVYWEENMAVVFALLAVGTNFCTKSEGQNPFTSLPVVITFSSYILAYTFRIYIMNYYKNTRPKNIKADNNKSFFALEQITSTITLLLVTGTIILLATKYGFTGERVDPIVKAVTSPDKNYWFTAILSGMAFGVVSFFSVFIFMFKGRTATFAGLVNRLTSLIAGTASTILFALFFGGKYPKVMDWILLGFILVAVGFMSKAEKRRKKELQS